MNKLLFAAPLLVVATSARAETPATTQVPGSPATSTPPDSDARPERDAQPAPDTTPAPDTMPAPPPGAAPRPTQTLDLAAIEALVENRIAAQPKTAGYEEGQGFYLAARDGAARLKISGYTQYDGRFFVGDEAQTLQNQFGFRSIRPELIGTVFENYDFRFLPDFAGGKLVVQEAYVEVHYSDAAKLRFGKFKVPFSLERLQPEVSTAFVERGLPSQLSPNRDLGVQLGGDLAKGIVNYQLGVFNGVADGGSGDSDTSDNKDLAARVFISPLAAGSDPHFKELGFGGAATYGYQHGIASQTDLGVLRTQGQNTFFTYKTGTTLMDTIVADGRHWRASAQADWFAGPFGLLAEYVHSSQHAALLSGPQRLVQLDSAQALGQIVLAGGKSTFKGVIPTAKLDPKSGHYGAFVVAGRLGWLWLDGDTAFQTGLADPSKSARKAFSTSAAFDWIPNRSMRFALDFDRTAFHGGAMTGDRATEISVVGRVQTVF